MRKIFITLSTLVLCLTSCDWDYCERCGKLVDCCVCGNYTNVNGANTFSSDSFVGEWQMSGGYDSQYMNGCGIIPKDIVFAKQKKGEFGKCVMTYAIGRDPQWYSTDMYYNYVRRELTFYTVNDLGKLEKFVSFTFRGFEFPSLYIQDSFGTYEWKKVR